MPPALSPLMHEDRTGNPQSPAARHRAAQLRDANFTRLRSRDRPLTFNLLASADHGQGPTPPRKFGLRVGRMLGQANTAGPASFAARLRQLRGVAR